MRFIYILLCISLYSFISCTTNREVDLIVYNGQVYTVDSAFSIQEAFAIKDGLFVEIGSSEKIQKKYTAKEVIDAKGAAVYPGLYDAHGHLFLLAELMDEVDLNGSQSISEVIYRLQNYHTHHPDKKWIIGGGWDQNLWDIKGFPTKDSLDLYFPNIPIFLSRTDYHAAWVNSAALTLIDSLHNVEGGEIILDENQQPTGILIDKAMNLLDDHLPIIQEKEYFPLLKRAQDSLFSVGLTSIVDAGLSFEQIDWLKKYYAGDSLDIRIYGMIATNPSNIKKVVKTKPYITDKFTIRSAKIMADGALGSRGASLIDKYSDADTKGFLLYPQQDIDDMIRLLSKTKLQVHTHAIGDSANKLILDTYGKYLNLDKDNRWRIEHAQIVQPKDIDKFKIFQIIPSIQPTHAISDMTWAQERLGKQRVKYAYAYQDLLNQYGSVAIGSDFPVEHYNPILGFHAAVARVDASGHPSGGFQKENAISREAALKGMTIWAAYSCFQENKRGSIEQGKDADFVILNQDIMEVAEKDVLSTKVLHTVIAGETVFKR